MTLPTAPMRTSWTSIYHFIWEHLTNLNCILQWLKYDSGIFYAKMLKLCVPTIIILSQWCNYIGNVPHKPKTQKIMDWPGQAAADCLVPVESSEYS
jgi:hypothetical protein